MYVYLYFILFPMIGFFQLRMSDGNECSLDKIDWNWPELEICLQGIFFSVYPPHFTSQVLKMKEAFSCMHIFFLAICANCWFYSPTSKILACQSLAVIEYLVANGSERAVDDIIEHTFQISVRMWLRDSSFFFFFFTNSFKWFCHTIHFSRLLHICVCVCARLLKLYMCYITVHLYLIYLNMYMLWRPFPVLNMLSQVGRIWESMCGRRWRT